MCRKDDTLYESHWVGVGAGAGGAMALPDFGRSVNPNSTNGTDYAPHKLT